MMPNLRARFSAARVSLPSVHGARWHELVAAWRGSQGYGRAMNEFWRNWSTISAPGVWRPLQDIAFPTRSTKRCGANLITPASRRPHPAARTQVSAEAAIVLSVLARQRQRSRSPRPICSRRVLAANAD